MLLLYLLLYQAKELRNAVPEGHVAGLGGYVNYRGNTVIVVVMVMAGYPRYIRRRRSCRLGFLAGSRALAGRGALAGSRALAGRGVCPHGVQGGILAYFYAFSAMIACGRSILVGAPSLKIVVSSGGFLTIYCKGSFFATFYRLCLRLL